MTRPKYAVYRSDRADGRPLLVDCLTECLKYAAHELKQGRGVTIEPEDAP